MSVFVPTTSVDVLRGSAPDPYGDPADVDVVVYRELPASLTETSRTTRDPASGTPRTIRSTTLRLRPGVALLAGDRIRDVASSIRYVIDDVATPTDLAGRADIVCSLTRVTATG